MAVPIDHVRAIYRLTAVPLICACVLLSSPPRADFLQFSSSRKADKQAMCVGCLFLQGVTGPAKDSRIFFVTSKLALNTVTVPSRVLGCGELRFKVYIG